MVIMFTSIVSFSSCAVSGTSLIGALICRSEISNNLMKAERLALVKIEVLVIVETITINELV
jgi:hypothetical protein